MSSLLRSLPDCRHRGRALGAGCWECHSPKVVAPPAGVTVNDCLRRCPYVDHPLQDETPSGATANNSTPIRVTPRPEAIAIAVRTAPRVESTLGQTISDLRTAGFDRQIHVFAEPGSPFVDSDGLQWHWATERLGAWRNWRRAALGLLEISNAPFLLLMEDDVQLAGDALLGLYRAIETLPHSDWGCASLYTPLRPLVGRTAASGWQPLAAEGSNWGSLAYCFSRHSLGETLAVCRTDGQRHVDFIVSAALERLGRQRYFHVPSLAEHRGAGASTLGHLPMIESTAVGFQPFARRYVPDFSASLPGKLAVVTSHFNPAGYQALQRNYKVFRGEMERAGVDLWTVEIAFPGQPFFLGDDPRVLRLVAQHVMFHKEQAINVLIERLSPEYDKVAWIDGDLRFRRPDWPQEIARQLNQFPVVQCFSEVLRLGPQGDLESAPTCSAAWAMAQGLRPWMVTNRAAPGYAWAARRELLAACPLYARVVVGGNDSAFLLGLWNCWDHVLLRRLPPEMLGDLRRWCAKLWPHVLGQVGYVGGTIEHLYHGQQRNRYYSSRYQLLCDWKFDPQQDLQIDASGLFRWADGKPELRRRVHEYFFARHEDDLPRPQDVPRP